MFVSDVEVTAFLRQFSLKNSCNSDLTSLLTFVNIVIGTRLSFFVFTITKVESAFRFFTCVTISSTALIEMESEVILI